MLVSRRHNYSVIFTITIITLHQSSTSYDISIDYNSQNPEKYKYKYNTPVEAGYPNQEEDTRLKHKS